MKDRDVLTLALLSIGGYFLYQSFKRDVAEQVMSDTRDEITSVPVRAANGVLGFIRGAFQSARSLITGTGPMDSRTVDDLRYFVPAEFGIWWPSMDRELLLQLDDFRHEWGAPVSISKAGGALGRNLTERDGSWHNVVRHGAVKAVDIFPHGVNGDRAQLKKAYDIAVRVGFKGIGVYPDWKQGSLSGGLHLDVRHTGFASWGGVRRNGRQVYVGIDEVI